MRIAVAAKKLAHISVMVLEISVIQIYHPHGDPVLLMIDCGHRRQFRFVFPGSIRHDGKVEGVRLIHGTYFQSGPVIVYPKTDIGIARIIPDQDRRIIVSVAAAVQVDASVEIIRKSASCPQEIAVGRRTDTVAGGSSGISVLQLIIIGGFSVRILIFREIP